MRTPTLLFILLFAGLGPAWAQVSGTRYIQAAAPLDEMDVRQIVGVLLDLDPNADVLHHFDDRSILQIQINESVDEQEMRAMIAARGISLLAQAPVITKQEPVYTTPEGRPLYVVTGDEAADRARYQQAISEWNASNPDDQLAMPPTIDGNN